MSKYRRYPSKLQVEKRRRALQKEDAATALTIGRGVMALVEYVNGVDRRHWLEGVPVSVSKPKRKAKKEP